MKTIFFILMAIAMVGCAPKNRGNQQNQTLCCGADASQMVFKSPGGREVVSWNEVTALEVNILPIERPTHQDGLDRIFVGDQAKAVIQQLKFAWPQQKGTPASMETGVIAIHYVHRGLSAKARTISIQNNRLLQDKAFSDVTYDPGMFLDKKWLESQ